jgi:uncharacterized protein YlxP (DUF503 family)
MEVLMDGAFSLKDKRSILKRIKKKLRDNFNIAISEIDYRDIWNKSKLAIVTVSSDSRHVDMLLQNVLKFTENDKDVELLKSSVEKF